MLKKFNTSGKLFLMSTAIILAGLILPVLAIDVDSLSKEDLQNYYLNNDLDSLEAALSSTKASIKIQTIYYLGELSRSDAINLLLDFFYKEPDYYQYIFESITKIGDHDAVTDLESIMVDPLYDVIIRNKACQAVIELCDINDINSIYNYFDTIPFKKLDISLIHSLTDKFYLKSLPPLKEFIKYSRNPNWLKLVLVDLNVTDEIIKILENNHLVNRKILIEALIETQPKDLISILKQNYQNDPDLEIQLIVLKYLATTLKKEAKAELFYSLDSGDSDLQSFAAEFILSEKLESFLPDLFIKYETANLKSKPYYIKIFSHFSFEPFKATFINSFNSATDKNIKIALIEAAPFYIHQQDNMLRIRPSELTSIKINKFKKTLIEQLIELNRDNSYKKYTEAAFKKINMQIIE